MRKTTIGLLAAAWGLALSSSLLHGERVLEFSGANTSYLEGPTGIAYESDDFSFFAWVKPSMTSEEALGKSGNIAGRWSMENRVFALCYGDKGVWALLYKDDADITGEAPEKLIVRTAIQTPLSPGEWSLIGLVVKGNEITLINGNEEKTRQFRPAFRDAFGRTNATQILIGGGVNVHKRGFEGQMRDISYWGRAVTSEELVKIRERKLNGTEADLTFFYNSSSETNETPMVIFDQGPAHANGRLKNASWVDDK